MSSLIFFVILAVFLTGAVFGAFVLMVVSIHIEERRMSLSRAPRTRAQESTRRFLGVYVRDDKPNDTPATHKPKR